MSIAAKLQHFLSTQKLDYSQVHHKPVVSSEQLSQLLNIPADQLLVATPVIDRQGVTFVIHSADTEIDVPRLDQALHRNFQMLTVKQTARLFKDCEQGATPALANAYGLPVVVDTSVLNLDFAWVRAGSLDTSIRLSRQALHQALHGLQTHDCVKSAYDPEPVQQALELDKKPLGTLDDVAKRLQKVYSLPPMPAIAVSILHLVTNPDSQVDDLVRVIEQDPSLSAQIMRYARSALFNFPGKIENVKDAVNIVLGFERVANIAMGIAAKRAFKLPESGPIGLNNFWRHSLYSAFLCQQIALQMPSEREVSPGNAYLCGLLHNFGILLMGEVFAPEYHALTQLIHEHPETPVSVLEKQVFGMGWAEDVISLGHGTIGGILLKLWDLPEAVVKCAAMHQVPHYEGDQKLYVKLVQLSNVLLNEQGIGEKDTYADVDSLFEELGFAADVGREIAMEALKFSTELDHLAAELAA